MAWGKIDRQKRLAVFLVVLSLLSLSLAALSTPRSIKKAFAVEPLNIGVYWNRNGTKEVTSIDWGTQTPGSTATVNVFVKNEELNIPCYVSFWTEEWTPPKAARYITMSQDFGSKPLSPNEIASVTLTLKIDTDVIGITDFNFKIIVMGTKNILGDINGDRVLNILDAVAFSTVFGLTPTSPEWNPNADLNGDGTINILDATILSACIEAHV